MRSKLYALCVIAILAAGCHAPDRVTSPDFSVAAARGTTTTAPTVTSTSPASSVRNVTLDVHIFGSGFDKGSTAQWALKGVPSSKVTTNSTSYVSSRELVANITIAADADVAYYDVIVTAASSGKPGIGTESFEVLVESLDLGTLGGGDAEATGINDAGQIVGGSFNSKGVNKPFLWENGAMRDLGLPSGGTWGRAEGINSSALVVGSAAVSGKFKPWKWTASTGLALLPLPNGIATGYAMGVNDAGTIVGSIDEIATSRAVVWNSGVITDLHPAPGGASEAFAINSLGDVLGAYHAAGTDAFDDGTAFVRLASGEIRWLPCPGTSCRGGGINSNRDVVGTVHYADGTKRAYRWADAGFGAHGPIGVTGTSGHGISDGGFVTGNFSFTIWVNEGAALWSNSGDMLPLQSESKSTSAKGSAFDVNSSGWVVGIVQKNVKGRAVHRATRWRVPIV